MKRVKKIDVVSLAKMMGLVYAVIGLILGALFSLASILGATLSSEANKPGTAVAGVLFGVGAVIAIPIFYGIAGFIGGLITGLVYNLAAKWVGGIQVEVEDVAVAPVPVAVQQ